MTGRFRLGMLFVLLFVSAQTFSQVSYAKGAEETFRKQSRPIGELRGVDLIDTHLRTHFFDDEHASTNRFKIESIAGTEIQGISALLGKYVDGERRRFSGGVPNPLNILVWQRLIDEFAFQTVQICSDSYQSPESVMVEMSGDAYKIHPAMAAPLMQLCRYEISYDSVLADVTLRSLWRQIVGYGLSSEEDSFVEFMSPQLVIPGADLLASALIAMLNHPAFLLAR